MQGEGPHVGETTLFVRFGGCDLRCRWCDSPGTWTRAASCRIETRRGTGTFRTVANPVSLDACLDAAEALDLAAHRYVALTGGEPLLQPEAVRVLARAVRERGPRVLLETHGLATEALAQVVDVVDVVSMDWKLASDVRRETDPRGAEAEPFHAAHRAFLETARRAPEVVVKVVVTPATRDDEIDAMSREIAAVDRETPLVIQPVTPFGPVREAPSAERVLEIAYRAGRSLSSVRVIPQTHKLYGAP